MSRNLVWYGRRLRQMSPGEVITRTRDQVRRTTWARQQVHCGDAVPLPAGVHEHRAFAGPLPPGTADLVPDEVRAGVVAAADRLLAGRWTLLGTSRPDIADPDWFWDPVTRRRAPQDTFAFRIDHRDEQVTGNVKSVWELSRHHHLTVLAAAWWLTGSDDYAEVAAAQLRSWWAANPPLSGVHWTSGIEAGVRLVSWAWARRLLDGWCGAAALFEENVEAVAQIWWHQRYLAAFPSTGSSANNHVVAEEAGRLVAACAFPWYAESAAWRETSARQLTQQLRANTFDSGLNRELATDYHRFVAELGLVAAVEADAAGHPVPEDLWDLLTRSVDVAAALLDSSGRPPRQGDGDEGRALVLADPDLDPWSQLLGFASAVVGPADWWPAVPSTVAGIAGAALAPRRRCTSGRPQRPPRVFADAGVALLRTPPEDGPELWCRCDGGPHGFLSIAAHAHADALSVELRHDGTEILVDPGTYCYHGEPRWRGYFRSTRAHNTVEVDGENQSVEGGPFLWTSHAGGTTLRAEVDPGSDQQWIASHDGYARLAAGPVGHERAVRLGRVDRSLTVIDQLTGTGRHDVRLLWHLGPEVDLAGSGATRELSWLGASGRHSAVLHLPDELTWSVHRGEEDPVLGWYSARFGERVPCTTLLGLGPLEGSLRLRTRIAFDPTSLEGVSEPW